MRRLVATALIALAASGTLVGVAASASHRPVSRWSLVESGSSALLKHQSVDGSFGDVAATAVCVRALVAIPLSLHPALAEGRDAAVDRATRWLLEQRGPAGAFGDEAGRPGPVRATALALRALAAADWTANARAILGARGWLESRQLTGDPLSTGAWPDSSGRPSVVVTETVLVALREAGAVPSDLAVGRGVAFLARARSSDVLRESSSLEAAPTLPTLAAGQRPDGSWSGVEGVAVATARALDALAILSDEDSR